MEQMVTVLEPLQIATTALCETEIVSCSLIYPVINGLLKKHLVPGESDLPTVKRFKEVVAQDIERRFNVSQAVKEQNITIFATITTTIFATIIVPGVLNMLHNSTADLYSHIT